MKDYHIIHNSTEFYEYLLSITGGQKKITQSGFLYSGETSLLNYEIERLIFTPGFETAFQKLIAKEPFVIRFIPHYEGIELTVFFEDEHWRRLKSIRCRLMFLFEDKSLNQKLEYCIVPGYHYALNIYLERSWLYNFLDIRAFFPYKYADVFAYIPDHEAERFWPALSEMKSVEMNGASKQIFLQAKSMELFSLALDFIAEQKTDHQARALHMRKEDILSLRNIHTEIENNYIDPPTLKELSRKYCVNMRKLTEGYKQLYGTTVYEFVISCRMKRALFCLRNLGLSVSEAAVEAGYVHLSHFIETFRKYYGFSPGEIKCQAK
ncbi:transcriptional regulator, AraC family [Syntrophobotulus glycolicus DSM 8271]|uniref:Transcriptional regulator, AraC family n=1 Tax=Syntrophobotulus glycolicus (strain DSM 8271 / FlGlyR) TaxID=645991 RepID=F0SVR0_SYNGF|nr:response regulator transcription factor [Syntrophobotulus glycolicus]ADY55616.1 transcriptional regulator, AraC family [Syntrophobotulus glycolicus DSM 8271]